MSNNKIKLLLQGKSENRIHPYLYNNNIDLWLMGCMYQGMMMFDENLELSNRLTETVINNENYTEYCIELKSGMLWSDGTPITSNDIVTSLELILSPEAPEELGRYFLNVIGAKSYKEGLSNNIKGVEVKSSLEVVVKLLSPDPYFRQRLLTPIVPNHVFKDIDRVSFFNNNYYDPYISSGPFILDKISEEGFEFKKNPNFHLGSPDIEIMEIKLGELGNLSSKVKNKDIDFAEINCDDIKILERVPEFNEYYNIHFLSKPTLNFMMFNHNNKYLKNKQIRKAIAFSLNKETINQKVYGGYAEVLDQYYSNLLGKYKSTSIVKYNHDRDLGKLLIDKELGDSYDFNLKLGCERNNKKQYLMAKLVAEDLKKININIDIVEYNNNSEWKKDFYNDKIDLYIFEYRHLISPNPNLFSPDAFFLELIKWNTLENAELIKEFSTNATESFKNWSDYISEELPVLFMFSPYEIQIIKKTIVNVKPSPRGLLWNIHELKICEE